MIKAFKSWSEAGEVAIKAAEVLGHNLCEFAVNRKTPSVRMGSCETCGGCCWISKGGVNPFTAGGRILKYRCGTKEARGVL